MGILMNEVDRVEILTLQDNTIDLVSRDNTDVVQRAMPLKGLEVKNSVLAEHGFSSVVTVTKGDRTRSILFDFGFSAHGAAFNADALDVDMGGIEAAALSHGHLDHVGGLAELLKQIGTKKRFVLVVHPEAFRDGRFMRVAENLNVTFPAFTREKVEGLDVELVETHGPYPLLDGDIFFLGAIPRVTDFERGTPNLYYLKDGEERWDDLADDTAIACHVKGKGLVVLSGCAHSGIINTVKYTREVSGVEKVYVVMGGFHLTGPEMGPVIDPTVTGLKEIDPVYVVPTHCTGRNAIMQIEREMPEKFLFNMSGTKLTFSA